MPSDVAMAMMTISKRNSDSTESNDSTRSKSIYPPLTITDVEEKWRVTVKLEHRKRSEACPYSPPNPQLIGPVGKYKYTKQDILKRVYDAGNHEDFAPQIHLKSNGVMVTSTPEAHALFAQIHKVQMQKHLAKNKSVPLVRTKEDMLNRAIGGGVPAGAAVLLNMIMKKKAAEKGILYGHQPLGFQLDGAVTPVDTLTKEYRFQIRHADWVAVLPEWRQGKNCTDLNTYLQFMHENALRVERGDPEMWDPAYMKTMEEAEDFRSWRVPLRNKDFHFDFIDIYAEIAAVNRGRELHSMQLFLMWGYVNALCDGPMWTPHDAGVYELVECGEVQLPKRGSKDPKGQWSPGEDGEGTEFLDACGP